jgi:hypothetical protein
LYEKQPRPYSVFKVLNIMRQVGRIRSLAAHHDKKIPQTEADPEVDEENSKAAYIQPKD